MKSKSLFLDPAQNEASLVDHDVLFNEKDVLVKWQVSCVCASERRRFNLKKSHSDFKKFIAGHESVGSSDGKNLFVLLPHSNCITRNEKVICPSCEEGKYNLCRCMNHAGLCSTEPGGLSEVAYVPKKQLLEVKNLAPNLAVFTEPLSCVLRSWKKVQRSKKDSIAIVGLGPIGCLHYVYSSILYPDSEFFLFEENLERIETFKKIFKEPNYTVNPKKCEVDISVMANSTSTGFEKAKKYVKKNGVLILFSGFNDISYKSNDFFPEYIHREEFNFFNDEIFYYGSSGYTEEDLNESVETLKSNHIFEKIITGSVYGLDSKKIHSHYSEDEIFDDPVLIKDIKSELPHHIKIQYYPNNKIET